jgi:serine/threonine protein kinase
MAREAPADAPAEDDVELEPGSLLGGYRIQGLLGRTAWASTYAAHVGETEVAIKLAASEGSDELIADLRTLRDEFRSVPGSLAAREEGRGGAPERPFFVTELCSHPSLADLVAVCPLTADEVVGLAASLAKALAPLHDAGVGHLAIKPTNIFVGPPPAHEVTIGDLGAELFRRVSRAQHGWLAPEQIAEPATGDPRTDVFAMGLVLFYALTGSSYWSSIDDASLIDEIRGARVAPSLRARDVGAELDVALDAVLLRALSADASARFASARAFADALAVHGEATVGVVPHEAAPEKEKALETALEEAPEKASEKAPPPKPPPLPSERHLKATAKLVRYELPDQKPIPNRTVKMPKADVTPRPAPNATALMPRVMDPMAPATPRRVRRFELPEAEAKPEPMPPPRLEPARMPTPTPKLTRAHLIAIGVGSAVLAVTLLLMVIVARC